jgi:hypothetical protein
LIRDDRDTAVASRRYQAQVLRHIQIGFELTFEDAATSRTPSFFAFASYKARPVFSKIFRLCSPLGNDRRYEFSLIRSFTFDRPDDSKSHHQHLNSKQQDEY